MADAPKKRGRPRTGMTDDQRDEILRQVAAGAYPERAARAAGVVGATMRSRRRSDKVFAQELDRAEACGESTLAGIVGEHATKIWQAAAWLLERRWPERWARPEIRNEILAVTVNTDDLVKAFNQGMQALGRRWCGGDPANLHTDAADTDGPAAEVVAEASRPVALFTPEGEQRLIESHAVPQHVAAGWRPVVDTEPSPQPTISRG
ncbi:MAG: hypothetical protein K8J09_19570 [Planctomycetes bacterium]|nr:hypothetical protein [Planctomycetota bacterium]